MARVKIKGLDKLGKKIKTLIKNDIATQKTLDDIGKMVVERIRAYARSGSTMHSGKKSRLKKLSKSYIEMRQGALKFRKINGVSVPLAEPDERLEEVDPEFFEPSKSQLTFTGQMLRGLTFLSRKTEVDIFVNEEKRSGKYEKLTNAEVAAHVAKNGRPFLGLDKQGVARVKKILLDNLRKAIVKKRL